MKNKIMLTNNKNKELAKREIEVGYISYRTLADSVGNMILCNNIQNRLYETMELINGNDCDDDGEYKEILQWYIITKAGAKILKYTNELVYYDNELDLYIWGITHYNTSWNYVFTNIKAVV